MDLYLYGGLAALALGVGYAVSRSMRKIREHQEAALLLHRRIRDEIIPQRRETPEMRNQRIAHWHPPIPKPEPDLRFVRHGAPASRQSRAYASSDLRQPTYYNPSLNKAMSERYPEDPMTPILLMGLAEMVGSSESPQLGASPAAPEGFTGGGGESGGGGASGSWDTGSSDSGSAGSDSSSSGGSE
jgi:uncharacterized membrane protein YgcG